MRNQSRPHDFPDIILLGVKSRFTIFLMNHEDFEEYDEPLFHLQCDGKSNCEGRDELRIGIWKSPKSMLGRSGISWRGHMPRQSWRLRVDGVMLEVARHILIPMPNQSEQSQSH